MITIPELIDLLNEDLIREYGAAIQYKQHAAVINGIYFAFAGMLYEHADEEISHAKALSEHINYLGGVPSVDLNKRNISNDAVAMLNLDLDGENEAIARYKERIAQCNEAGEYGTVAILLDILKDEEEHANEIETILGGN
jgi:bacterioferritin